MDQLKIKLQLLICGDLPPFSVVITLSVFIVSSYCHCIRVFGMHLYNKDWRSKWYSNHRIAWCIKLNWCDHLLLMSYWWAEFMTHLSFINNHGSCISLAFDSGNFNYAQGLNHSYTTLPMVWWATYLVLIAKHFNSY